MAAKGKADARHRGRPRRNLSHPQVAEFLRLIGAGYGRVDACEAVGVSYKTFLRHLRERKRFADRLALAEERRGERCDYLLYRMATGYGDCTIAMKAAMAYLARRDRRDPATRPGPEAAGSPLPSAE